MRKTKKIIIFLLIMICVIGNATMSYAAGTGKTVIQNDGASVGSGTTIDVESELGIKLDDFKPTIDEGDNNALGIISNILGILTILGVIATVVFLAIIGFSSILGSASEKAVAKERYMGIVIGSILITSVSVIAKLVITVAESI